METIKDQSFGVVPIVQVDGEWQILLVQQISYRGKCRTFWTFPKGHPEANETYLQTAARELEEETGIKKVQLIEQAKFQINYSFIHDGARVEKTVTYFLGVCIDRQAAISLPEEIAALTWLSFADARKKLTHKNAQKVLLEASQYINNHLTLHA